MDHIEYVRQEGLYDIAALAAGGAIQAARLGLETPTFGAIRPPGHHASRDSCWGFCYFNNMAVALLTLKDEGLIETATILDFDLHYGDGNVNILDHRKLGDNLQSGKPYPRQLSRGGGDLHRGAPGRHNWHISGFRPSPG
jgi:hypothetical protein